MIARYGRCRRERMIPGTRSLVTLIQETIMKWETPEAIDMRFGMEITMYISNR
jgi:coenzyme PQQ precursor peptide PqqA